jgi:Fe-S-cluster containining protein
MTKHFKCTACGKCCFGQLPLTWKDAVANAGLFPLGFVWSPVLQTSKDYKAVSELGAVISLPDRKQLAVLIVPTSFIPSSFPCPALQSNNLCGIHAEKPSRCKTMPFYPYREERFQAEVLIPHKDWECDTSDSAPVVFDAGKIFDRKDFDQERNELLQQLPLIRRYAQYMLKYTHGLAMSLSLAASRPKGGHVVTSLSSFLTATNYVDAPSLAHLQIPVLNKYMELTSRDAQFSEFNRYYSQWAKEMQFLSKQASKHGLNNPVNSPC